MGGYATARRVFPFTLDHASISAAFICVSQPHFLDGTWSRSSSLPPLVLASNFNAKRVVVSDASEGKFSRVFHLQTGSIAGREKLQSARVRTRYVPLEGKDGNFPFSTIGEE